VIPCEHTDRGLIGFTDAVISLFDATDDSYHRTLTTPVCGSIVPIPS
jgi:hypothetical protein